MRVADIFVQACEKWLGFIDDRIASAQRGGVDCENLVRLLSVLRKRLESRNCLDAVSAVQSSPRALMFARAILRAETGVVALEMRDRLVGSERQLLGMAVADGEEFFRKKFAETNPDMSTPDEGRMRTLRRSAPRGRAVLRLLDGGGAPTSCDAGYCAERISGTILLLLLRDGARPELGVQGILETSCGRTGFCAEGIASQSLLRMGVGAAVALDGKLRQRIFHVESASPSLRMVGDRA